MTAAAQLDMLPESPGWARSWGSLTAQQRAGQRMRWIELMTPRVRRLAEKAGPEGITASDVISDAIVVGIFWGEAAFIERYPRVYAWVGPWLAQLARVGRLQPMLVPLSGGGQLHVTRKSERGASHRNRNAVYLLPGVGR